MEIECVFTANSVFFCGFYDVSMSQSTFELSLNVLWHISLTIVVQFLRIPTF